MSFRRIVLSGIIVLFVHVLKAQSDTTNWNFGGDMNLTFFQSSFQNWTDGDEATTTIGTLVNVFAKYRKGRGNWDNIGLLQYQIQKNSENVDFLKTIDRLEFLSIAAYNVSINNTSKWHYSFLTSLKTQMTATKKESILQSRFFAPAEILVAPGMKYSRGDKKTKTNLLVNISPATAKFVIVNDQVLADSGTFTSEPAIYDSLGNKLVDGSRVRTEFGASLVGNYRLKVIESDNVKLTWQTNIELLSNYLENPLNIDIKWTNLVNASLFKYFTISLSTDLRYDDNIAVPIDADGDGVFESEGPRTRFAQTFGIGVGYKF